LALFGGSGKKFLAALNEHLPDWRKLRSLSEGLGKDRGGTDKVVLSLLLQRACDDEGVPLDVFGAILRNLTSSGLDLDFPIGPRGETALHLAVTAERATVAEALVLAGASPVATSAGGGTALHTAASRGSLGLVEILVNAGADINAEDSEGNTPLHSAVSRKGNVRIADYLVSRGAIVWSRNREGKTPLRLAAFMGNDEYDRTLQEALAKHRTNGSLSWKCPSCAGPLERPSPGRVEWLVQIGAWEYMTFRCGKCGTIAPAPVLDGER
jgi:ankyrin repeat protein